MKICSRHNYVSSLAALAVIVVLVVPGLAWAQSLEPEFDYLTVSLWPEFDSPGLLVIYRGRLSADTALPARLTFTLPGYVQEMHAIAVRQDGGLVNVDAELVESVYEGDDLLLTITAEAPEIQFEYYDSEILIREGQNRAFTFTLTAPYPVGAAALEVQHPFRASEVSLNPEPSETRIGGDGLTYSSLQTTDLEVGGTLDVSVSFQRAGSELSIDLLQAQPPAQAVQPTAAESPDTGSSVRGAIIYALVGAGLVLLLWLVWEVAVRPTFAQRPSRAQPRQSAVRPRRGPSRSTRRGGSAVNTEDAAADSIVRFCHLCGSSLRKDADFCHRCGAQRKAR